VKKLGLHQQRAVVGKNQSWACLGSCLKRGIVLAVVAYELSFDFMNLACLCKKKGMRLVFMSLCFFSVDAVSSDTVNRELSDQIDIEVWVRQVRSSVLSVHAMDQTGRLVSTQTGFVISKDGLIATHIDVLKIGCELKVEFEDGRLLKVDEIRASDSIARLAILKVTGSGYRPLLLGNGDLTKVWDQAIAMGHSVGIKSNILRGLFLERNRIDGQERLSTDIVVEADYLGGPLLNIDGEVVGVLSGNRSENSGLAIKVSDLERMIATPNPMSMAAWLASAELDPKQWRSVFGAQWYQKDGLIQVNDQGLSFGGRALCLWQTSRPKVPLEISVQVKMDADAGAAGLVFHADGEDQHYGFYPSNGSMRLTYFGGPDVYSWEIIEEVKSIHYHSEDWNTLKVKLEAGHIECFLNGQMVITSDHAKRLSGRVGLAKFRDTKALFKNFKISELENIPEDSLAKLESISKLVDKLPDLSNLAQADIDKISQEPALTRRVLENKQRLLEKELSKTKSLMQEIQFQDVNKTMVELLAHDEQDIDLWRLALLIAKLDNSELDVDYYEAKLDHFAGQLLKNSQNLSVLELKQKLDHFLFNEHGFHGARFD